MAVPAAPIATTTPAMAGLLTDIVSRIVISSLRLGRFFLPPSAVLFDTYPAPGHTDKYIFGSYEDILIDPTAMASYLLAEGVTPTATAFASDVNNFTTAEYARLVTVTSEQIRTNPSPGGFFSTVAEKVASAAQDLLDAAAANVWGGYVGKLPIVLPGATPANTNPIDTKSILKAVTSLQQRGVLPIDGTAYGGMATPAVLATLMSQAAGGDWVDAARYAGPERLLTGEVGTFRGVKWFANARIPAKSASIFPAYVFGKEAIAFADLSSLRVTSVPPVPSISDPLGQRGAAGFAVRTGGMLVSDVAADSTTRRYRAVVIESTPDAAVVPA